VSFNDDKTFGEAAATALARWFSTLGLSVEFSHGEFAAWDLSVSGTVEVKRDRRAAQTGNFFVESSAHGQPSGIAASRARAWAFVTGSTAYLIGTEKLRAVLDTLRQVEGPDGKRGHLLPVHVLASLPYVKRAELRGFLQ
jgi:hypothetical protein